MSDPGTDTSSSTTDTRDTTMEDWPRLIDLDVLDTLPSIVMQPGWRAWRDGVDERLARHGIRCTSAPNHHDSGNNGNHSSDGDNAARTYYQPLQPHPRAGNIAGTYLRPDRRPRCYVCLVNAVVRDQSWLDDQRTHAKLAYLCHDCRTLAREVCLREVERNQGAALGHVLDAFFAYVWKLIPDDMDDVLALSPHPHASPSHRDGR